MPWGIVDEGVDVTERANFSSRGTMPVDSMSFGISPWGSHHAAGNVAEWCLNEMPPGRLVLGGGWNDAVYAFGKVGGYPAMFSNDTMINPETWNTILGTMIAVRDAHGW